MLVGRVWGGYPRISGLQVSVLGFSLCPQVFGFGYPKSNGFGADLNLYPRIHRRGSGKQHELPSRAADPAWPRTSSPRPTRLAVGALLLMGQSKAVRPEAAPSVFYIFIFFKIVFYRNIFSVSQFTVLYPYRPAGGLLLPPAGQ